jgi:hypothetical protein
MEGNNDKPTPLQEMIMNCLRGVYQERSLEIVMSRDVYVNLMHGETLKLKTARERNEFLPPNQQRITIEDCHEAIRFINDKDLDTPHYMTFNAGEKVFYLLPRSKPKRSPFE